MRPLLTLTLLLLLVDRAAALQGTVVAIERAKLETPIPLEERRFGYRVDVSGDTAIVGRRFSGGPDEQPQFQSAHVFVRQGGSWTLQDELFASDTEHGDRYGSAVAIDGDTAIVGAHTNSEPATGHGSAYVFVRTGTTWTQQAKLVGDEPGAGLRFGWAVDVCGDTALIGAPGRQRAYVFVRSGTTWTQQTRLQPSETILWMGSAARLDGDTAVLGPDRSNLSTTWPFVFVRNGTTWTEQTKLELGGPDPWHSAGLDIEGDTIIAAVGPSTGNTGVAAFARTGGTWTHQDTMTGVNPAESFGTSAALSGDTAVIGATVNVCVEPGSAYVVTRSGSSWTPAWKFTSSGGDPFDRFGIDVAVEGTTVLVGADNHHARGVVDSGAAYVYSLEPGFPGSGSCFGTGCPCGNDDPLPLDRGCVTSRGVGAELFATGTSSVSADDLVLHVADIPSPNANGLFFMGNTLLPPFSPSSADGFACTGGALRFDGLIDDGVPPDELVLPNVVSKAQTLGVPILPGCVRHFQSWFRDNNGSPCGGASNLSNAYTVSFNP